MRARGARQATWLATHAHSTATVSLPGLFCATASFFVFSLPLRSSSTLCPLAMSTDGEHSGIPSSQEAPLSPLVRAELEALEQRVTTSMAQSIKQALEPFLRLIPAPAAGTGEAGASTPSAPTPPQASAGEFCSCLNRLGLVTWA